MCFVFNWCFLLHGSMECMRSKYINKLCPMLHYVPHCLIIYKIADQKMKQCWLTSCLEVNKVCKTNCMNSSETGMYIPM